MKIKVWCHLSIMSLTTLVIMLTSSCNDQRYPQGKRIYEYHCSSCHMQDGSGLSDLYPSMSTSDYVASLADELPCLILQGREGSRLANVQMPPNSDLTEAEMYNLVNFVLSNWGTNQELTLLELRSSLSNCNNHILK